MPVVYGNKSVFDAAVERIEYIFDEFDNIVVDCSGGKDSTVILNLALRVAERRGRLPLPVLFVDQEAEWDCTISYVKEVMYDDRVKPYWMQIPFRIFNATSADQEWLHAWEPGKQWIREKDPISIKKNPTPTDRFADLFKECGKWIFNNERHAHLAGVRCEESPARRQGLTIYSTYKWITWGKKEDPKRDQYAFYPLYDWTYRDIWKAIHDEGWAYCKLYDYMYQYGVPVVDMRVSNVTHETAVKNLYFLQEIEGDLWSRLTNRVQGVSTVKHLQKDWDAPIDLPFMFDSWAEYRDHLLENLVTDPAHRETMRGHIKSDMENYLPEIHDKLIKLHIKMILANDYHSTKRTTFAAAHGRLSRNHKAKRTKRNQELGFEP